MSKHAYVFGPEAEIIVNHLRRLADKIEEGDCTVMSLADTLEFAQEEFATNTLIVKYTDKRDQINLRMVSPAFAVLRKFREE